MLLSTLATWMLFSIPASLDYQDLLKQEGNLKPSQTLTSLLSQFSVQPATIAETIHNAKHVFNPRDMRVGQAWQAYLGKQDRGLRYLVYRENPRDSIVFEFIKPVKVTRHTRSVDYVERLSKGTIQQSLFSALEAQDEPEVLALLMKDFFAGDIAFGKLQKGDSFRILYEAQQLDDRIVGRPHIKAASLIHKGRTYYRFAVNGRILDETGLGNKPVFLKAPIKNGGVTSHYTRRRYHPILKRYQPHLGTDYGAKKGTPIIALADGTITKVAKDRYNGRYVKIRHDRVYETQYLHMTRWAKHLRTGQRVHQGDVIGYVGNTGLAYGYHVCLRFWKRGKQVNFCEQTFPKSKEKLDKETLGKIRKLKLALDPSGT